MEQTNIINFRCQHRHSAASHPACYLRYMGGDKSIKLPKILLFDIETSPLKAFVFQKSVWGANVSADKVISEWWTICWSAKWLFDDTILSSRVTREEAKLEDDSRIIKQLWELLNEAEIVIAHNGDSFDVPNMNTRFIINGLPPTVPYKTIDTKTIAKKQFGFTHNSLNGLATVFGLTPKLDTDFELWKGCMEGNKDALVKMEEYNRHDVELLELIYLKLRPWIRSHPNIGLYNITDGAVCPNCGSTEIQWIPNQFSYTGVSKFPIFRCKCGAYGRSRKSVLTPDEKKSLVVSIAK